MENINNAWQAASEEMYKATQESQGGAEGSADVNSEGGDDDIDVEFEEVKEDN